MSKLDKVNSKFREQVDLLFFSDRMDLDLSNFKSLLKENYDAHFTYVWDRFKKSSEIAWEIGSEFWNNRLSFLFSLNEKTISKYIEEYLEKRMFALIRSKHELNIKYDIEYLQFLELCKIKHYKKETLLSVKNYLTEMPAYIKLDKLINIVNAFIPYVFSDIDEFTQILIKKIIVSSRNFDLLMELESQGVKFNKKPIVQLAKDILNEKKATIKHRRAFFTLINNQYILFNLKKEYSSYHKENLIYLIESCDYEIIEEFHLRNIINVIKLDPTITDDVATIYADKLYARNAGHKRSNADRLIKLLKRVPEISPKRILVYLSSNNKMSDIKYILESFPELKKLSAFV